MYTLHLLYSYLILDNDNNWIFKVIFELINKLYITSYGEFRGAIWNNIWKSDDTAH